MLEETLSAVANLNKLMKRNPNKSRKKPRKQLRIMQNKIKRRTSKLLEKQKSKVEWSTPQLPRKLIHWQRKWPPNYSG